MRSKSCPLKEVLLLEMIQKQFVVIQQLVLGILLMNKGEIC